MEQLVICCERCGQNYDLTGYEVDTFFSCECGESLYHPHHPAHPSMRSGAVGLPPLTGGLPPLTGGLPPLTGGLPPLEGGFAGMPFPPPPSQLAPFPSLSMSAAPAEPGGRMGGGISIGEMSPIDPQVTAAQPGFSMDEYLRMQEEDAGQSVDAIAQGPYVDASQSAEEESSGEGVGRDPSGAVSRESIDSISASSASGSGFRRAVEEAMSASFEPSASPSAADPSLAASSDSRELRASRVRAHPGGPAGSDPFEPMPARGPSHRSSARESSQDLPVSREDSRRALEETGSIHDVVEGAQESAELGAVSVLDRAALGSSPRVTPPAQVAPALDDVPPRESKATTNRAKENVASGSRLAAPQGIDLQGGEVMEAHQRGGSVEPMLTRNLAASKLASPDAVLGKKEVAVDSQELLVTPQASLKSVDFSIEDLDVAIDQGDRFDWELALKQRDAQIDQLQKDYRQLETDFKVLQGDMRESLSLVQQQWSQIQAERGEAQEEVVTLVEETLGLQEGLTQQIQQLEQEQALLFEELLVVAKKEWGALQDAQDAAQEARISTLEARLAQLEGALLAPDKEETAD